jgi:tetratricopeptide (TPR) repeat protein
MSRLTLRALGRPQYKQALVSMALVVAIFAVYFPAWQGGMQWDDESHLTRPELRSLAGLWRIWFQFGATQQYYPLLHSAFWLEYQLWDGAVIGYHLVNLAQHALSTLLLLQILRRLEIPGALLASAIFAFHPVHVESVAWMTEQKNTLSTVFYLAAVLVYLHFDTQRRIKLYLYAFLLFVLALLTKTVVATLPAALLVIFWYQRGRLSWRKDVLPLIPWFIVGAAAGLFTAWVERQFIGARGDWFELSLLERCLLAARVVWFYLAKIIWPSNLMFIYPRWEIIPSVWSEYAYVFVVVMLVTLAWTLRDSTRGPLAALLFFIGTLFPVLGFVNVFPFLYSFVADHFQYTASIGLIAGLCGGIVTYLNRATPALRRVGQAACLLALTALMALTWQRAAIFKDSITLYRATIRQNPRCWMCYNNLGIALAESGQTWQAIEQYEASLRILPGNSLAENNLGYALAKVGLTPMAVKHYRRALEIAPIYDVARVNLAKALLELGQPAEALEHFQQALAHKPHIVVAQAAHEGLAKALSSLGDTAEARKHEQLAQQLQSAIRVERAN